MCSIPKRLSILKSCFYSRHCGSIPLCPQELLKVHGIHLQLFFLGWYKDVLYILFDTYQRSRLNIIISAIGYQILYCLTCRGKQLDFVKNNDSPSFGQIFSFDYKQIPEKCIKISDIVFEVLEQILCFQREVQQNIIIVFIPGKSFCNCAFSDSSGSLNQDCAFPIRCFLPID